MSREVSQFDKEQLQRIRKNVSEFIAEGAKQYDVPNSTILDIAPQDHEGASPHFLQAAVETLDIDPDSGATYIADICKNNAEIIPSRRFDVVVCTEVLEHVLQPFNAVNEIMRILKPNGVALISTPYNFRIHGPLPDCWRFTEHGLRELFKEFEIVSIKALEDEDRFLAPAHYTLVARKRP